MKVFEIKISEDFDRFLKAASYASCSGLTHEEILKRWLSNGFAYDMVGGQLHGPAQEKAGSLVNQHIRLLRK